MSHGLSARALVDELEQLERDLRAAALTLVKAQQQEAAKRATYAELQDDAIDAFDDWEDAEVAAKLAEAEAQSIIARMCELHEGAPSVTGATLTKRQQAVLAASPLLLAGNLINKLRQMEKEGRL